MREELIQIRLPIITGPSIVVYSSASVSLSFKYTEAKLLRRKYIGDIHEYLGGGGSKKPPSPPSAGLGATLKFLGSGLIGPMDALLMIPADIRGSFAPNGLRGPGERRPGDRGPIDDRLIIPTDMREYARSFSARERDRLRSRSGFGDETVGSIEVLLNMPTE